MPATVTNVDNFTQSQKRRSTNMQPCRPSVKSEQRDQLPTTEGSGATRVAWTGTAAIGVELCLQGCDTCIATNQTNHAILYLYLVRRYIRYQFYLRYSITAAQQDSAFKMSPIEAKSINIWLRYDPKHLESIWGHISGKY